MPTTAILGLQWGDEGKGKLVDSISAEQNFCVRFQGGGNAGHTVYPEGGKIVLHHLPTGVLHKDCVNLMAQGMVVDPLRLIDEIGVDRVMWSSDYPHNESTWGYSEKSLATVVEAVGPVPEGAGVCVDLPETRHHRVCPSWVGGERVV